MSPLLMGLLLLAGDVTDQPTGQVMKFLDGRQSSSGEVKLPPTEWSAEKNVEWKTDIPGLAWSSPLVLGNRLFLTTCETTGKDQEPQKGLYLNDLDARKYPPVKDVHRWKVLCLDLTTGSVVWEKIAHEAVPPKPHHIKNTLASETPCTDGKHLFVCFGNIGLYCYTLDGELVWKHLIDARETKLGWGTSQSPIVYEGTIYQCLDNEEDSRLWAFDAKTGKALWDVKREEPTNYSTPFIWKTPNRTELIVSGINWCQSYDTAGKPLWKIKGRSILAIPTPFEHEGLLYVTSGHVAWGENPIYCIKPGAEGDISPVEKKPLPSSLAWHQPTGGPYHPTPLILDGILYILLDRGFMSAYDAKTGEPIYVKKRIPNGRAFTSSPWSYDNKIFAINEDGVTFVFTSGRDFKIEGKNELADDDMCMATPVLAGDRLLIRTSARIYSIRSK